MGINVAKGDRFDLGKNASGFEFHTIGAGYNNDGVFYYVSIQCVCVR